jgi:GT2 family glycosyltransferase
MYCPKLAIIIPTFNRIDETRSIIQQLLNQDFIDYKILICDSGSTDGTESLDEEFPGVKILHVGSNKWWTGAINAGIEYACQSGFPLTLLLNDDLKIPANLLTKLLFYHTSNPDLIITPLQLDLKGNYYLGSVFSGILRSRRGVSEHTKSPVFIDSSNGCCLLIPTAYFKRIGPINENLIPHYGGDIYIYIRAKNCGIKCLAVPDIVIEQTSSTNYSGKINLKTMLFHPSSHVHLKTYFFVGHELFGTWVKFAFFGVKNHFSFLKEIMGTIKRLYIEGRLFS